MTGPQFDLGTLFADKPVAGFYKRRLVRGGPWVVVEIWHGFGRDPVTGETIERGYHWRATQDGRQVSIWEVWPMAASYPIPRQEADRLIGKKDDPDAPENYPRNSIDLGKMKPIF